MDVHSNRESTFVTSSYILSSTLDVRSNRESTFVPCTGRIKMRRGITMDSGAAQNVMRRKMVRDQSRIRPSEGSKRGAHYVAANDGRIPNEGEFDFAFQTLEGTPEAMTFQVGEVSKAPGSISYLVDHGY